MCKSAYPLYLTSAILLFSIILTSCGGSSKRDTLHIGEAYKGEAYKGTIKTQAFSKEVIATQARIEAIAQQAHLEKPKTTALKQLEALSQDSSIPEQSRGQAALQHAELLFYFEQPNAFTINTSRLTQWSDHTYAPQVRLTLAKQFAQLNNHESAIHHLTLALMQPTISHTLRTDILKTTEPLLQNVSVPSRIRWLLAASTANTEDRDIWLQQAAKLSSLEYVLQLRLSDHPLHIGQANYYQYVARERLMVGDYHAVRVIAKVLEADMPNAEATIIVQQWAKSEGEQSIVGVLLPLSGKYATYGQQALQGIRLAMSRPEFEGHIILRVQDTAGKNHQTINAYQQLINQGVQWIIGPLLSSNTEALIPYLAHNIPVIALSNQVQLAASSPALFMHSLSKTIQASFMAQYAIDQGQRRMVIMHTTRQSSIEEAATFSQVFTRAGGEIIDILVLEKGVYDNRPALMALRSRIDDEEHLAALDEELNLFSAEQNMAIKMPLNIDAIYIAAPGKKISVLAGQMAYSAMHHTQFYGSYRWFDGHLMDDKGRYLNRAEFATPVTSLPQPDQAILDVQSQYRVIWGADNDITPLFALAYDTAMNVASLGSRLGLQGRRAIRALNTTTEFPAISGNYHFDHQGVSQKAFAIQRIRRGRIESKTHQ